MNELKNAITLLNSLDECDNLLAIYSRTNDKGIDRVRDELREVSEHLKGFQKLLFCLEVDSDKISNRI